MKKGEKEGKLKWWSLDILTTWELTSGGIDKVGEGSFLIRFLIQVYALVNPIRNLKT
jgi:hypothetical protein